MKNLFQKRISALLAVFTACSLLFSGCSVEFAFPEDTVQESSQITGSNETGEISLKNIPEYSGEAFVELNGGMPDFSDSLFTTKSVEHYSELDALGRCGVAYANLAKDLMPTEARESISSVKPSGWVNVPYDFVDGRYLYNRCHLIGFQLAGENANKLNLITGTRYLNVEGMLPFENMVADYIKETDDHVLYRITPIFEGDNLVASGVQMEAISVSDKGESICFNVYCYNVQPGVVIDYATGESREDTSAFEGKEGSYVLNTSSKKFHLPECSGANTMNPANRQEFTGNRELLIAQGYTPCSRCNP